MSSVFPLAPWKKVCYDFFVPGQIHQIDLRQLIQLIERYEMPKTVTKKAVEAKKSTTKIPTGKVVDGKTETGKKFSKTTATKKVAPVTKPEAKKSVAPRGKTKEGYTPQKDSMRQFVFQALQKGPASVKKIKIRAAALAAKAGVKQYSTEESFAAFDVVFFVKMLGEKGLTVVNDGKKYGVTA